MTCNEVRRRLEALDALILVLDARRGALTRHESDVLRMLRTRHGALRGLLTVRQSETRKKIISLDLWRRGDAGPDARLTLS